MYVCVSADGAETNHIKDEPASATDGLRCDDADGLHAHTPTARIRTKKVTRIWSISAVDEIKSETRGDAASTETPLLSPGTRALALAHD